MSEVSSSDWSETPASNNATAPDGWPEGQSPATVNDCGREMMSALKKFWGRIQGKYASTGSSNAYVVSPDVDLAAYVTGERYSFRANFANTGSATLNISSLGAKTIKYNGGAGKASLQGGEIQSGQPVTVEYDGTDMILCTPVAADEGTWTPAIAGATTAGTQTYQAGGQVGRYIRMGNLVWAVFQISMSAKDATTAGNLRVTGLPFTATNTTGLQHSVAVGPYGGFDLSAGKSQLGMYIAPNTDYIQLFECGDNVAAATLGAAALSNSTVLNGTAVYRIG